jgi:hypothetical protein
MGKLYRTLQVVRLFLGADSGNRGVEVTATADQINQLAGGSYTGDVTGNVTGSASKLLAASAPANAVPAIGTLTMTGVGVDGEILTVGDDIYEILTGTTLANGTIAVDCTASHAAADVITNLVAAQVASGTEPFTFLDSDGDTMTITADVAGVLANAEVLTTDFTNGTVDGSGTFADATQAGVDGTVGEAGTTIVGSLGLYVCKATNTISDANWKLFPHEQYMGTGAAPQTISVTTDMGETDFLSNVIFLDGTTACAITDWTPTVGVTYVLECIDSTADPVVTLTSGITINSTGNDKMTFPDADDSIVLKMVSATRMVILSNNGAVTLATAA